MKPKELQRSEHFEPDTIEGTKRPAVQSRLSTLWKELPSTHSRIQPHTFPLLFPALNFQLCKLHGPGRIIHKMNTKASYQPGTLLCKQLKKQWSKIATCRQVGKDQGMHISFWGSLAEAVLPTGLWQPSLNHKAQFCLCTVSWVPELSPLPATCLGWEAELWPKSPVWEDGWCQSSHSDHCWRSVKSPEPTCLPAHQPAHAESSFCASLNGEVLEKVTGTKQSWRLERFFLITPDFVPKQGFSDCTKQQPHPSTCRYQPNTFSMSSSPASQTLLTVQATNQNVLQ